MHIYRVGFCEYNISDLHSIVESTQAGAKDDARHIAKKMQSKGYEKFTAITILCTIANK